MEKAAAFVAPGSVGTWAESGNWEKWMDHWEKVVKTVGNWVESDSTEAQRVQNSSHAAINHAQMELVLVHECLKL